jgi:NTP pyrophosphatase (non-canonical NTP hydrolase)
MNDEILEELLIILMEECAEVTQKASKILRFGTTGGGGREALAKEIGDLVCMIELLEVYGVVSKIELNENTEAKREKLKEWSNLPLQPGQILNPNGSV